MGGSRRLIEYFSHSANETFEYGRTLGCDLPIPTVICLFGELGAGKTTFIKGLVSGAAELNPSIVQSPTFSYMNIYEGKKKIYHFDLYRMRDMDEFLSMGFDEYFDAEGICCIEWSERIQDYLPPHCLNVHMKHIQGDQRCISLSRN